jgi:pimeloyl-ACP methyl ester carboxylesterase
MLAEQAPDNLASLTGFFTRQPRPVTAELLTRISRDGPGITEAQLAALSIPALVIGHGEDVIHPLSHARQLSAAIPGARLSEIPPKAQGRSAYESAFRTALSQFIQEMLDDSSRTRLV